MKKILFLGFAFVLFSQVVFSQINGGLGITYKLGDPNNLFGLQAKGMLNVDENWKFVAAYNYYLGNNASYAIDADVHYELLTIGEDFHLLPLLGINWTEYGGNSDIGLNVGLFTNFRVNDNKLHIYFEPKYLISDGNGFIITSGVLF